MDIRHHPQDMGHLPILYYPHRPPGTSIAMAISAMVELFFRSSIVFNSLMGVGLIPMHVGRDLRPEIIVRQFPPMVHTYLKSTTGGIFGSRWNPIAVKLLRKRRMSKIIRYLCTTSFGFLYLKI